MIISIASGKGGTGKTFLATNMARVLENRDVGILDCDVEEPDDRLFLKPEITERIPVKLPIPQVDENLCIHCGKCSEVCAYHAITDVVNNVLVFPQMCHGCGACALICPVGAIIETEHKVGEVHKGKAGKISFTSGSMNVKEVAAPHIIRKVREYILPGKINLIDAPPGTTCPTVAAVSNSDYCVLVTEPTPFGLNDLELAIEMTRQLGVPSGVVINRHGIGDDQVENFCREKGIKLLMKIPHNREIAKIYAGGGLAVDELPWLRDMIEELADILVNQGKEVLRP